MPRSRKVANGSADADAAAKERRASSAHSSPDSPPGPLSVAPPAGVRERVKVNNASATDLKNACDDAVKRYLARPELFTQIHTHTDIRLTLGWSSVFTAAATGLYGWKTEFEKSKPLVWAGLILYILLTTLQTLYSYFIEGDIVFVGRRKSFSKRIVTERLTIASTNKASPSPLYQLSLDYIRSTSGGKSLLARGKTSGEKPYAEFFDATGVMDQIAFESWVGGLVEEAMEGSS